MHLLWSCFVGAVIGFGARGLAPEGVADNLAPTVLLGMVGALLTDALAHTPGLSHPGDLLLGFLGPVLGAMIAIGSYYADRWWTLRRADLRRSKTRSPGGARRRTPPRDRGVPGALEGGRRGP
jgi:uncharacterized membrane protein YeaQ/YmgE (transglycosylase-associated protein family)